MIRTNLFRSNRSQAVRLPKPVALPDDVHEVEITVLGSSRVISPVGRRWRDFFEHGPRVSDDFMEDREQPAVQERESL